jgi:hypothetical protein
MHRMIPRLVLAAAVALPAIASSAPALAWSENNCRMACAIAAGRERAPACIARIPCAKYSGQPEVSAAEVRRRVAAVKTARAKNPANFAFVNCARQAGATPGPRGWLYYERQVPAIDACVTAANRKR